MGRVLVTGAGGMLGSAIVPTFRTLVPRLLATDKVASDPWLEQLDITEEASLAATFDEFGPDLVLHLAAETDLEFCEEHPRTAEAVNARGTETVARLAEARKATLVYISTAGVFDGTKEGLYTEADSPNPIMVYGRTKLEGEQLVRGLCTRHYIVRAGWMVGGGPGKDHKFVQKILAQIAGGRKRIHAVDDRWGTPTYTQDFASNLIELLASAKYGTYHMVCEGQGTRFDVAKEIVRICGRDEISVVRVDSSFFREEYPAPRPRSEMLRNANLAALGINRMRRWQDALTAYVETEYGHLLVGESRSSLAARNRTGFPLRRAPGIVG